MSPIGEVGDDLAEATTNNNRLRVEEVHTAEQPQGEVPLEAEVLEEPSPSEHLWVGGRLVHFKDRWSFSPRTQSFVSKGLEGSWKDGKPLDIRQFFQRPTPLVWEGPFIEVSSEKDQKDQAPRLSVLCIQTGYKQKKGLFWI